MPLSSEEIQTRIEESYKRAYPSDDPKAEAQTQMTIPILDALGRKLSNHKPTLVASNLGSRITVLEDHSLKVPELWLNVFVFGPEAGSNFNKMFARAKCFKAETPDDADLVVFSGSGHDIDPQLYGQTMHKSTGINPALDEQNMVLYHFCHKRGIPMFGVCGGAQLLHVANGGELYQDVDGHNGSHTMYSHPDKMLIESVSSVHHQMCRSNVTGGMEIIATSRKSTERWVNANECLRGPSHADIEAFFYRETCCFGVQGHPEYAGYNKYTVWCLGQLDRLLNENPDLSYRHNGVGANKLRIKQELLEERDAGKQLIIVTEQKA